MAEWLRSGLQIRAPEFDSRSGLQDPFRQPAVWVVTFNIGEPADILDFTSRDVAKRVVQAADHATDLCSAPKAGF